MSRICLNAIKIICLLISIRESSLAKFGYVAVVLGDGPREFSQIYSNRNS